MSRVTRVPVPKGKSSKMETYDLKVEVSASKISSGKKSPTRDKQKFASEVVGSGENIARYIVSRGRRTA